jgi:stage V sporulation protein G
LFVVEIVPALEEEPRETRYELAITEVRVELYRARAGDILRAFASITLNGCFAVHNLRIIDGEKGLFVAMPARKYPDGRHSDIAHPTDKSFREYMESVVLTEYERVRAAAALP